MEVHRVRVVERDDHRNVVDVQHLGPVLDRDALRGDRSCPRCTSARRGTGPRSGSSGTCGSTDVIRSSYFMSWGTSPSPISTTCRIGLGGSDCAIAFAKCCAKNAWTMPTSVPQRPHDVIDYQDGESQVDRFVAPAQKCRPHSSKY